MANIAPSSTPTCDSIYNETYTCSKAIDEDTGTRWLSGSGQPHDIELEWPSPVSFEQIRFWAQGAGGEQFSEYYIEHWDGGWVEDVHVSSFNTWTAWVEHAVDFTTTKIRFRTVAGDAYTGLSELEAYEKSIVAKFSGIIKEQGDPVIRTVISYIRSTGVKYSSGVSEEDGSFSIDAPDTTTECFIVALDNGEGDQYNALIYDRVKGVV